MPLIGIELTTRKRIERAAALYCDIGDDEAWMMRWNDIVYGGREDAVSSIEEPDHEEGEDGCCTELACRTNLSN